MDIQHKTKLVNQLLIAHVGAFAGGVDEEGLPMMRLFRATSPGGCFEEALRLSSTCIYLLSPTHTQSDTHAE